MAAARRIWQRGGGGQSGPLNLGRLLHLKLFLDVQVGVRLYRDPITGLVRLVIGNCLNNPGHLRVTLFDNSRPLSQILNNLLRTVTDVLEKTLPYILQRELCPIANGVIRGVLNVLQGSFSSGAHGEKIFLTATSFSLQNQVVQLGFHGSLQMSGGIKYEMTPSSTPLPQVPLGGSSMNLVLSDHFLCSVTLAQLSPQVINVASPREISIFSQQVAAVPGYSLPKDTIIRSLQIAYKAPALSLRVGRIQIAQQIEIKVFGDYQVIFAVHARVVALAGVSVAGSNLKFHLGLERVDNITLSRSSVGSIYARQLVLPISQLVTTSLLSHENNLLSEGLPLPLVQDLGLTRLDVAVGKGALLVFAPRQPLPAGHPALGGVPGLA